jgi:hypothetical protein
LPERAREPISILGHSRASAHLTIGKTDSKRTAVHRRIQQWGGDAKTKLIIKRTIIRNKIDSVKADAGLQRNALSVDGQGWITTNRPTDGHGDPIKNRQTALGLCDRWLKNEVAGYGRDEL